MLEGEHEKFWSFLQRASLKIIHKLSEKAKQGTGKDFVSCSLQGSLSWLDAFKL